MAKYFTATAINFAVTDISRSSVRSRYFEFLMLKRTFIISGESNVAFAEGDSAYKQAINELGSVNEGSPNAQYINIFSTSDNSNGYRSGRYISNGPNTTVGSPAWQGIISIDNSVRPRKVSLATSYENSLSSFLLKRPSRKPDIYSFSIWVNRFSDISTLLENFDYIENTEGLLSLLVEDTVNKYGLTLDEINILFDKSPIRNINDHSLSSLIQDEIASPSEYLPSISNVTIEDNRPQVDSEQLLKKIFLQQIYFGAPGSGKSRRVKEDTEGMKVFRTTFHPDSDYAGFVGTYKPTMVGGEITYAFVPQLFTKAYVHAWQNPQQAVCLVIEEINRGNCAQIFGDLFQLLDRGADGFSEYELQVDTDMSAFLSEQLVTNQAYTGYTGGYESMKLPPNLAIYATMNTSDQSLFPMDSAFKRRWNWEYVPIDYADADTFTIVLGDDEQYSWGDFIRVVNKQIADVTESDDKQLGNRFVNPADGKITKATFKSKVLFYLWSEVFKHEQKESLTNIFKYELTENGQSTTVPFTFADLWEANEAAMLTSFMALLNVPRKPVEA